MSDKQYAENLNTGGGSGGASEPSDSYEEVSTGLKDADGNMIYKKSYKNFNSGVIDSTLTLSTHEIVDIKGHCTGVTDQNIPISFYTDTQYRSIIDIENNGLQWIKGSGVKDSNNYLTIYYIHKPVQRASAKKTSK